MNLSKRIKAGMFVILSAIVPATPLVARNDLVPGGLSLPHPTLTNLAVEWVISGDDNLNATCEVRYRRAGANEWKEGMPLLRVPADKSIGTTPVFMWENKLSGSLFDLRPGTEYEIALRLRDPDGGKKDTVVTVATRAVPRSAPDGQVKKVTIGTFAEAAQVANPGDILELAPGWYGEFELMRDGEPGRPIVIRADGSDPSIGSTFDGISLRGRKHVILDGVRVFGSVDLAGASDIAVTRCTVHAKFGIIAKQRPGAADCYIADNTVSWVMPWVSEAMGGSLCVGEGIEMTGPGNVICFNRVSGYHDCISTMEDLGVFDQRCIDIYNNDITQANEDAVEADFCQGNCRVMRNRITNCFTALSTQPGLGGPTYFIRNAIYNCTNIPFKLSRQSKGDVFLHNTVVKVGDGFMLVHDPERCVFRNNLTIGGTGGGKFGHYSAGDGMAINFPNYNATCDIDYDGFGTCGTPFTGRIGRNTISGIQELKRACSEKHAVMVDMSVFAGAPAFPDPAIPLRQPFDLSLAPGSAAVDAGVVIPNVTDGYAGKAPDLGACELGLPVPHYGPRPDGVDELTEWETRNFGK